MEDLDTQIRRVDEDRWLASRFASKDVRSRLIALYAVNYEIARTAEIVREPGIGFIRLAWWREALEEIAQGGEPRAHPALVAYASADISAPPRAWESMIEARSVDFEASPFASWDAVEAYLDATSGNLFRLAFVVCGAPTADQTLALSAGQAWGYAGLLRSRAVWDARGRSIFPRSGASSEEIMRRAKHAYAEARAASGAAPSGVFPALGYLTLVPAYLHALVRGATSRLLLTRQLRLVAAAATGRI